jgi:hypothetical protein
MKQGKRHLPLSSEHGDVVIIENCDDKFRVIDKL